MRITILFITLLLSNLSFAQNKYDLDQFINEGVDYYFAPFKWTSKDLLYLGLTVGATYSAMQFDNDFKEFTQRNRKEYSSLPILAGRFYGEPLTPIVLSTFFIVNGNSNASAYQKKMGFEIIQSTFYAFATTQLIKIVLGRERPEFTDDNMSFNGFTLFDNDYFSLPSAHTAIAFALSTVLSQNSKSDVLKVVSYLPALVTSYSRIYENRHWFSDVVLGGIIGFVTAKYFVALHDEKDMLQDESPQPLFSISIPIR